MEKQHEQRDPGKNHPVDTGHLLALIRNQHFENEAFVSQHLAHCARCQQNYATLIQTSKTLDVLGQIAQSQRYPELTTAQLMKNARLGYSQRRFSGRRAARYAYDGTRSPMRLMSLPFALALILLTIVIMITLALVGIGKISQQLNGSGNNVHTGTNPFSTGIVAQMPTPSTTPVLTLTPGAVSQPTLTATSSAARFISNCTTPFDKAHHFLDICGSNFTPGDKVSLLVAYFSRPAQPFITVKVSASGTFDDRVYIPSCKDG
ncbi:MAG TPA: hypothetical protein VGT44_24015, partial [Ktedonobacteraceae bacterium]|nr:hypothetical protein [Ktedonobacteraceae bacterium]